MTGQDTLIAWLNDAHGMETSLVQVLEHQIKDAQDYPQIQSRVQQHLEETKRHADLVKSCVERLGGKTSTIKSGMSTVMGKVQALSTGVAQDELIKNALQAYAAESFEVASYTSLITCAQALGDQESAAICQQILAEDQAMATWILQNIPMVTTEMMNKLTVGSSR